MIVHVTRVNAPALDPTCEELEGNPSGLLDPYDYGYDIQKILRIKNNKV